MSFLSEKTNETRQQLALQSGRNPVTGQVITMPPPDRTVYMKFTADYTSALSPDGMVEVQLAHKLAQDTWRINRCHAIEENMFALAHSEKFADIESSHPEIHASMVQALRYIDSPKLFTLLSLYEQRITKNFHANMKLLLHLQSLRQRAPKKEKAMTANAASASAGAGFENRTANPESTATVDPDQTPNAA